MFKFLHIDHSSVAESLHLPLSVNAAGAKEFTIYSLPALPPAHQADLCAFFLTRLARAAA
jgi:hypothetical protein